MRGELLRYANEVLFSVATLLPIVKPFGSAPIFLSTTADLPVEAQRRLANVVGRYAFLLLTGAMLVGSYVRRSFCCVSASASSGAASWNWCSRC